MSLYCGDNCNHTGPHHYPPVFLPPAPEPSAEAAPQWQVDNVGRFLDHMSEPSAEADAAHPDWRDATPEQWDTARDALTDAAHFDAMLIERYPLQRDNYVAYIVAKAASERPATPPLDVDALLHPERLRRAAIYVLQLATKDISPLLGERLRDAILTDDREYAALAIPDPETGQPNDIVHPSDPRW